ncbi:hypothetical protein C9374_004727 [Naegleria lovaniensis]|uniref:Guanylate cyclase n=1 Tax=Naegleria lovaniensis TaxID=51637 RepID=A0AA88KKM8_NAELO|nr:uncharacterized protein C9374_004727 [Naegleria lovaniensis]KAG2382760.1 hypothetical protein C9374_004727 [Naegleria lovaniensis]
MPALTPEELLPLAVSYSSTMAAVHHQQQQQHGNDQTQQTTNTTPSHINKNISNDETSFQQSEDDGQSRTDLARTISALPNNHQQPIEKVSIPNLPTFFTPCLLKNQTSPIIHYDRDRSMIITCKYTPQNYKTYISLPLNKDDTVYCVKVAMTTSAVPQLETDAEIAQYLQKHLEQTDIVPHVFTYISDYLILVREFVNGVSFRHFIDNNSELDLVNCDSTLRQTRLERILEIAIQMCSAIDQMHVARVCHCDLRPENLIYDIEHSCVKLIDFGQAVFLPLNNPYIFTDRPVGSFLYMPPEATGKISKPLGFHCDIYSFGFVLFEMFAKEHPFKTGSNNKVKSTADYMYYHITQQPESLVNVLKRKIMLSDDQADQLFAQSIHALSLVISMMVRKPIEKRYISIEGVKQDLKWILQHIQTNDLSALANFTPAQFDIQTTINIPYVVYGREEMIQHLYGALKEMENSSLPKLILVRGYSGIGKSCLVHEFRIKYHEFIIESVLGESEQFITEFTSQLTSLLGRIQIEMLCNSVPNFSCLLPAQKRTNGMTQQVREDTIQMFAQAVIFLMQVFSQKKNKRLCIFLDDLQWTDFESMKLLKEMIGLGSCETIPFLLIGAFRDNEVYGSTLHPLQTFIESIRPLTSITEVEVKELTEDSCNLLVAESLKRSLQDTTNLTNILFSKTKGNPFFLKQLLASLFGEGKIYFNRKLNQLTWSIEDIEKAPYALNVVDFLLLQLNNLQVETRKALAFASCIGNSFSLSQLCDLLNSKQMEYSILGLKDIVAQAITQGWISYVDSHTLQFNHDRLQQAANESVSENTRNYIHYSFGKYLLKHKSDKSLDEIIFDIVAHLNYRAKDSKIIEREDKRRLLLDLNTRAAKKAITTCAMEQAQSFVRTAMDLLQYETDIWEGPLYNTAFDLLIARGNCEYVKNIELAIETFNSLIQKSKTRSHLYEACYYTSMAYVALGEFEKVFDMFKNHIFPIHDELKFLSFQVDEEQLKTFIFNKMNHLKHDLLQTFKSKQDVLELPDMSDLEQMNFINMLGMSIPAIYVMKVPFSPYIYMITLLVSTETVLQYEEAFLVTLKAGNKDVGAFVILFYPYFHFFEANGDMKTSISLSLKSIELFKQMGNIGMIDAGMMQLEMKRVLCGESEKFEPAYCMDVLNQPFFSQFHYVFKGISYYFQRNITEAFDALEKAYELRASTDSLDEVLERCDTLMEFALQTMEKLSQTNPLLYQCCYELLKAETLYCKNVRYSTQSDTREIISSLNRCLKHALQDRNLFILKLANWRTGVLYKNLGMEDCVSGRYFSLAYDQYNTMGITVMATHIWENYRTQIEEYYRQVSNQSVPSSVLLDTSETPSSYDEASLYSLNTSLKASNDLDLKEIFISVLPLLREQTNSSRCCLILKRNSILYVDAESTEIEVDDEHVATVKPYEHLRLDQVPHESMLPLKLIYRTLRTKSEQIYPTEGIEKVEIYFEKNQVSTAMCVPIIRDRSSIGCIYLEQKKINHVFSMETIKIAKLILSISMDNVEIFSSINKSYARFLPSEFLKILGKTHVTKVELGDAISKEMTVLFADIMGFTELMENFTAKHGFRFINRLLIELAPPVRKFGGFIHKILGDAIVALFSDAQSAVNAAMDMISNLDNFNRNNMSNIKIGIGLSKGLLNIGTIGYDYRLDSTIISDTIAIADWCQTMTRLFHSSILATENVVKSMSSDDDTSKKTIVTYVGKFVFKENEPAWNLHDIKSKHWKHVCFETAHEQTHLSQMISSFQSRDFTTCSHLAGKLVKSKSSFAVALSRKYLENCSLNTNEPLSASWSGEIRLS